MPAQRSNRHIRRARYIFPLLFDIRRLYASGRVCVNSEPTRISFVVNVQTRDINTRDIDTRDRSLASDRRSGGADVSSSVA
jgi:hypothetical protein